MSLGFLTSGVSGVSDSHTNWAAPLFSHMQNADFLMTRLIFSTITYVRLCNMHVHVHVKYCDVNGYRYQNFSSILSFRWIESVSTIHV